MSVFDAPPAGRADVAFASSSTPGFLMRVPRVGHPFRVAMVWQAAVTAVIAIVAAFASGAGGFLSALAGGGIGIVGVLVFALVSGDGFSLPAARAMRVALRAEGARIAAIVLLLWLSLAGYHDVVVVPAFLGAFIVSIFLSGVAFAVPNK